MASRIPDSVERPPIEKMDELVTKLYQVELVNRQRLLAKEQKNRVK